MNRKEMYLTGLGLAKEFLEQEQFQLYCEQAEKLMINDYRVSIQDFKEMYSVMVTLGYNLTVNMK